MRLSRILLALTASTGCDSASPGETSCVEHVHIDSRRQRPPSADILLVIDRSVAMAPYLESLETNLRQLGINLEWIPADLHLSSMAADLGAAGALARDCSAAQGDFVFDLLEPWWRCSEIPSAGCRITNRTTSLSETTACIGHFGANAAESPRGALGSNPYRRSGRLGSARSRGGSAEHLVRGDRRR